MATNQNGNSTNPYDRRRGYVNPYGKQSLQTGASNKADNVDATPIPYSEQHKPGTGIPSKPVRQGLDPTIYDRQTQAPVAVGSTETSLFTSVYPWFLVPRPTSANVIQRQKVDFSSISLPNNSYLDALVLNVSRAQGSQFSSVAGTLPAAPPTVPQNTLTASGEAIQGRQPYEASENRFPTGSGGTISAVAGASTFTPASKGEFYKISGFGHSEVPTSTAGITYQVWVDSRLMMEWNDFQWSPVTPKQDQWHFDVPLFVESQIVFRIINETGSTVNTGTIEACFSGWSEQKMGFLETDKVQIETI
jgi:hypothetical protein